MKRRHLMHVAIVSAAISAFAACNRADTRAQTEQARADVKAAAEKAGDRLTDGWLTTKIQAQYFAEKDIKARYIDVSTRDRRVTLDGYVDSQVQRDRAEQIARNTDGVASVDDRLKIGVAPENARADSHTEVGTSGRGRDQSSGISGHIDDALVTSMIEAKYFQDPDVKARSIDVTTKDGVVTLRGQVDNEMERAQALKLARDTQGVQRVEDALTVRTRE